MKTKSKKFQLRLEPGEYRERVFIEGKDGLTIEAADPSDPPTIRGTPKASRDGIRVDRVEGIVLRGLRIVGAYDGIRLNSVTGALLEDLHVENNALGVRITEMPATPERVWAVLGAK